MNWCQQIHSEENRRLDHPHEIERERETHTQMALAKSWLVSVELATL